MPCAASPPTRMNIVEENGKDTPMPAPPAATVAASAGLTPERFIHGTVTEPTAAVTAAPTWAIAPNMPPATVAVYTGPPRNRPSTEFSRSISRSRTGVLVSK